MEQKNILKGVLLVALGASFYGMLATFVKLAYKEGYTIEEVTLSQLSLGVIGMFLITIFQRRVRGIKLPKIQKNDTKKLLLVGTSLGLTSLFYYSSVLYINVSVAVVLLMQSVWMSVLIEAILSRTFPNVRKIIAVGIVLFGTLLATNILKNDIQLNWIGIFWGFMAAISFSTTMYASNRIANYLPAYKKSLIMLLGGFLVVSCFVIYNYNGSFNYAIFLKWGLILSFFGTIIPPLFFNAGFPKSGLGLGSIVSSLELPVSVLMAHFLLSEKVSIWQWIGIFLILIAIVMINIRFKRKKNIF